MRRTLGAAVDGATPAARRGLRRRLLWLFVCLVVGIAVGATGTLLAGDSAWFLAVPACLAVGWFWLADPQQCLPAASSRRDRPLPPKGHA
jgi:hypothetical protein